jgi:hypothetical protein
MVKCQRIVPAVLVIALPLGVLSCQARKPVPNAVAEANRVVDKGVTERATNINRELRSWPGAYPEPTGLKGLRSMALVVYADRGIPSDRIAAGSFAKEIENRFSQKLRAAGIALVNEKQAESVLSVSMYLSCEADGLSCGHHTTLELRQWVQLERDPTIAVAATTWHNSYTNGIRKKELHCCLPDLLEVDAGSLMEGFLRDYRTANPK